MKAKGTFWPVVNGQLTELMKIIFYKKFLKTE